MENQIKDGRANHGSEVKKEIVLKAVWGKQQGRLILCPARDGITQKMKGVEILSPDEARGKVRVVSENTIREIKDGLVLDLTNEVDRVDWQWLKECKEIAENLDEAQSSYAALFFVEDLDREVIDRVRFSDLRYEATKLIKESADFRKSEITKLLGKDPKHLRPLDIADYLDDLAQKKPQMIIDVYNDADYKLKLFLMNLIDTKIVHRDQNGFFKYETIVLGVNQATAIQWLKDPINANYVTQFHKMLNPIDFKPADSISEVKEVTETILDNSPDAAEEIIDENKNNEDIVNNETDLGPTSEGTDNEKTEEVASEDNGAEAPKEEVKEEPKADAGSSTAPKRVVRAKPKPKTQSKPKGKNKPSKK